MKQIVQICLVFALFMPCFAFGQSSINSPFIEKGLDKGISITGKIIRSDETRIVVTSKADTVMDVKFDTDIYSIVLSLRQIQTIDIYNHEGRQKSMTLINFTSKSEVIMFDVDFNNRQSIALSKYRSSDPEGKWRETKYNLENWKRDR